MIAWANAHAGLLYAGCAIWALLRALSARNLALVILATLLLADCAFWNATLLGYGFVDAPSLLIVLDGASCGFVTLLWGITGLPAARRVAIIFLPSLAAWAMFAAFDAQSSFVCYLTANALFLAQVVTTGRAGVPLARLLGDPGPGALHPDSLRWHGHLDARDGTERAAPPEAEA